MVPDKIIYTDGHDITVTDTELQVKKKTYKLDGIIKHGLMIMKPERLPAIILMALGVIALLIGLLELIAPTTIADAYIDGSFVSANTIAIWIGAGLLAIGVIMLAVMRERYAVRIFTAEGEKNAVVSKSREYVTQIIAALNTAFGRYRVPGSTYITTYQEES